MNSRMDSLSNFPLILISLNWIFQCIYIVLICLVNGFCCSKMVCFSKLVQINCLQSKRLTTETVMLVSTSPWTIMKLSVCTNLLNLCCLWCINKWQQAWRHTDALSSSKKHTFSSPINTFSELSVHTEPTEVLFIHTAIYTIYKTGLLVKRFTGWQEVKT